MRGFEPLLFPFASLYAFLSSKEICEANTTIMCPLCDQKCPFWYLSETCTYAKVGGPLPKTGLGQRVGKRSSWCCSHTTREQSHPKKLATTRRSPPLTPRVRRRCSQVVISIPTKGELES